MVQSSDDVTISACRPFICSGTSGWAIPGFIVPLAAWSCSSPKIIVALLTALTKWLGQKKARIQQPCMEGSSRNITCMLLKFEANDVAEQNEFLPLMVHVQGTVVYVLAGQQIAAGNY